MNYRPQRKGADAATLKLVRGVTSRPVALGRTGLGRTGVPDIQHFDDAIERGNKLVEKKTGDAGDVWIEFLLGLAPQKVYGGKTIKPRTGGVVWLRKKTRTLEEFRRGNKARYHETLKVIYESDCVDLVAGNLVSIRLSRAGEAEMLGTITKNGHSINVLGPHTAVFATEISKK